MIREFESHRFAEQEEESFEPADLKLFEAVLRGVVGDQEGIDRRIDKVLAAGWSLPRIDSILRAILRAGAWELAHRPDVPAKVAITEYVDIAHAFFEGEERKFVNGVLDRLARDLRPADLEASGDGGA